MRYFIIIFLIYSNCFSQKRVDTLYNFKTQKDEVIWQKIYQNKDSTYISKIKKQLRNQQFTSKLKETPNSFIGRSNNTNKRLALKKIPYFAYWGFDCYLTIEFKKNRFRVTATDFLFRGPTQRVFGQEKKQDYPLNINTLRKGKFRTNKKTKKAMYLLDSVLNNNFTLKQLKNEDW